MVCAARAFVSRKIFDSILGSWVGGERHGKGLFRQGTRSAVEEEWIDGKKVEIGCCVQ